MLLGIERDAVAVVCHRIDYVIQISGVEDIPDIGKEGVGQPANPDSLAQKHVNIVGWRVALGVYVGFNRRTRIWRVGQAAAVVTNQVIPASKGN